MKRFLRRTLLGLALILVLAASAIAALLWWSLPPSRDTAAMPGLAAPVHIGLDEHGIPRIEAANALDGATALGFVHARDRMFQMELTRRVASGRLSEIASSATIRLDRAMRTLGLRHRAQADLAAIAPDTSAILESYARGVNAWITLHGRFAAPEFIALGAPEPWTPTDSLLWGKTMALYLSGNWRQELVRAALMARLPPDRIRALWPAQDYRESAFDPHLSQAATRLAALIPSFPDPFTLPSSASNEWAVDGKHSATGAPLLAGDPHLAFSMPSIWYLARIATPQGVLAGATAPGVPFLILGHNGRVAWTFTTTGADTQDVFIETPAGPGAYATPEGPRLFDTRTETIHVRGAPDETITIRETRHGPVLSDLDDPNGPILAVAMTALQPNDTAPTGLLALNRATTVEDARAAAPQIAAPVQNLLVADRTNIARFTTGLIPIRRAGDGTIPVQGADGLHDWTGLARGDQLPHALNPPSGALVNANERTAPPDFPVFMGQDWFGDWRARRIRTLLEARSTHSLSSFAQMQTDPVSTFAVAVLPRLLRTEPSDPASRTALATLKRWDGSMRIDQAQPLLFNDWMRRFETAQLAADGVDRFDEGVQSDMIGRALASTGDPAGGTAASASETAWCGPGCGDRLARTLAEAVAANDRELRWGEVHQAEFQHPFLGRIPLLGQLFTWRTEQPGDDTTLFRGSPRAPDWTSVHGPAFRGVYDLANLDASLFALAPGQSGHPLRRQASSLLAFWRQGATIKLGKQAVEAESIDLVPR